MLYIVNYDVIDMKLWRLDVKVHGILPFHNHLLNFYKGHQINVSIKIGFIVLD